MENQVIEAVTLAGSADNLDFSILDFFKRIFSFSFKIFVKNQK